MGPHQEEFKILRLFNEKVDRLQNSSFAKRYGDELPEVIATWQSVETTRTSDKDVEMTGVVVSHLSQHDQDSIDAFVLTFRMFIQKSDRVSLKSLEKIYNKSWMPEEAKASFIEAKRAVDEYLASDIFLEVKGESISRGFLVDTILYGGLAHSDASKESKFRKWTRSGAAGFIWVEFVVAMKDMLKYLVFFRKLNEAVLANVASAS